MNNPTNTRIGDKLIRHGLMYGTGTAVPAAQPPRCLRGGNDGREPGSAGA